MAITTTGFAATDLPTLTSAINTAFSGLTNAIFRGLFIEPWFMQRMAGDPALRAALTTASGGGAIATPFVFAGFQASNPVDAVAAAQTFINANPTYFFSAVRVMHFNPPNRTPFVIAWLVYNTTAGASANFLPL